MVVIANSHPWRITGKGVGGRLPCSRVSVFTPLYGSVRLSRQERRPVGISLWSEGK